MMKNFKMPAAATHALYVLQGPAYETSLGCMKDILEVWEK